MNFLLAIVVSILYGAVPNDTTVNNANAINTAISDCADKGGGVVEVPEGTFTTGSVFLRSGVTLRLNEGAVLLGSSRLSDYSSLVTDLDLSRYESGQGTVNYKQRHGSTMVEGYDFRCRMCVVLALKVQAA